MAFPSDLILSDVWVSIDHYFTDEWEITPPKFDACIGYLSVTASKSPEWKQWWLNPDNVRLYQFMGKDNVYFHTIYWPSILRGDGRNWSRLHHLSTTGTRHATVPVPC